MESDSRLGSLKRKFSSATFKYNLMIGFPEKNKENYPKEAFEQRNKETQIKIQPWICT